MSNDLVAGVPRVLVEFWRVQGNGVPQGVLEYLRKTNTRALNNALNIASFESIEKLSLWTYIVELMRDAPGDVLCLEMGQLSVRDFWFM